MQPKFTLKTLGFFGLRIAALILILALSTQFSFSQTKEELKAQQQGSTFVVNPQYTPAPVTVSTDPAASALTGTRQNQTQSVTQRGNSVNSGNILAAPTTISTLVGSTGYIGQLSIFNTNPLSIAFVVENTNSQAIKITDLTYLIGTFGGLHPPGTACVSKLFYSTTLLSGNYDLSVGWTQIATGSYVIPAVDTETPVIQGMCFLMPPNTQYRFILELSRGLLTSGVGFPPPPTPNTFSAGGVILKNGDFQIAAQDVGYAGVSPVPAAGNHPAFYCGSITFDVCSPNPSSQPTISSVPSNTCAGQPITLSIISGNLNGACNWVWYAGGCGVGAPVGTGTSITVSPAVNTTYYARGEGGAGCAAGNGPCGQQTVTVTPCTCMTPDVATICAGSIQMLSVTPIGATTVTTPNGPGIALNGGNGAPYPSNIAVAGLPTCGVKVQSVTINGISHSWPGDIDILLRSPSGQSVILMSDVGDAAPNGIFGASIILTDGAPAIPAPIVNGTYRPSNSTGTFGIEPDAFPAPATPPAPINPNSPTLSSFSAGNNANGNWSLYAVDDFAGDVGSIASWSITFKIVPTAIWSGPAGTMWADPNATIPYTGTCTDAIWVTPATTTTYTAVVSSGPCAGPQSVTVTVLPRPTITISPNPGGCAPVTLTASGGSIYNWSPGAGLNTTTGPTVIATPTVDQTYTVVGYGANGCSNTASVPVKGISIASTITADPPALLLLSQGFETVVPPGWTATNLSNPIGVIGWFQGNAGVFPAQSGPPTSYAGCNFNSGGGLSDISNWLTTPQVTVKNGDSLVFWTRSINSVFPDRMQIRMSPTGGNSVGATNVSVGDFTVLIHDINPTLAQGGYPGAWTRFAFEVTGMPNPTTIRYAFRYFVAGGGPFGANADYIGLDNVTVKRTLPGVCPNTVSTIMVNITGGVAPYTLIFTDGTTQTIFNNYTSGTPIQVSPSVTTTYTVANVIGANGCPGIGNTGSVTIVVIQPPSITSQPANQTVCAGQSVTFTAGASPNVFTTSYQWEISTNGGGTWNPVPAAAPYSGVNTPSLTINPVTAAMNGHRFRLVVSGQCPPTPVTSASATLTVNVPAAITTHPANRTVCAGQSASFSVVASTAVGTVTYQWQVSVDGGVTWTIAPGTGNTATYTINPTTILMNNYQYRVVVSVPPCATTVTSNPATLFVNPLPVVTISSTDLAITPGQTTVITGTSVPAASPTGWSWTLNGAVVPAPPNPPANGPSITVGIEGLGVYQATATTAVTGCSAKSNLLTIGAEQSDRLWIYPNPNNGLFQIRLYFDGNIAERRRVRIYNSGGALVAQKEFDLVQGSPSYMSMQFVLPRLAAGTYVAKVTGLVSGNIVSGLFVVSQ